MKREREKKKGKRIKRGSMWDHFFRMGASGVRRECDWWKGQTLSPPDSILELETTND